MSTAINAQNPKIVHVAVGLVMRADQVLICWRDAGLHQGNRYEFPGGKIEYGETAQQALARELKEEINIEVKSLVRAQKIYFNYPEKTVCLHVFKVTAFHGEPLGQQNQAVRWVNKHELGQYQFPDANALILRMALLPDHYLITKTQAPQQTLNQWLDWHITYTPQQAWLYVRNKQFDNSCFNNKYIDQSSYYQAIITLAKQRPDLRLFAMYSQVKVLQPLWSELESLITGVHLSQRDLMQLDSVIRLPAAWYRFAACHDADSIIQANHFQMDALLLSPLHATRTHAAQTGLGWSVWQQLCEKSVIPVYALGGVSPNELIQVQQTGGFGVAGIRAFYPSALAHQ